MRGRRRARLLAAGILGFVAGSGISAVLISLLALLARRWSPGSSPHAASLEYVIWLFLMLPGTAAGGITGAVLLVRVFRR